jgi:hypothetical protein
VSIDHFHADAGVDLDLLERRSTRENLPQINGYQSGVCETTYLVTNACEGIHVTLHGVAAKGLDIIRFRHQQFRS